jgi:hypothetical protein
LRSRMSRAISVADLKCVFIEIHMLLLMFPEPAEATLAPPRSNAFRPS